MGQVPLSPTLTLAAHFHNCTHCAFELRHALPLIVCGPVLCSDTKELSSVMMNPTSLQRILNTQLFRDAGALLTSSLLTVLIHSTFPRPSRNIIKWVCFLVLYFRSILA